MLSQKKGLAGTEDGRGFIVKEGSKTACQTTQRGVGEGAKTTGIGVRGRWRRRGKKRGP